MAVDALDLEHEATPYTASGPGGIAPTTAPGPGVRSRIASILGLRWDAGTHVAVPPARPDVEPWWRAAPGDVPAESFAAARAEDAPVRLSMYGLLTAWRVAERALGVLAEGSPEWAAVNATIISLRSSYRARFDEYVGDPPDQD